MGLSGVDDVKIDLITVRCIKVIVGSTLLPEWRSGEGTVDQHNRFLFKQIGEAIGNSTNVQ
jgi:hypothetical protein